MVGFWVLLVLLVVVKGEVPKYVFPFCADCPRNATVSFRVPLAAIDYSAPPHTCLQFQSESMNITQPVLLCNPQQHGSDYVYFWNTTATPKSDLPKVMKALKSSSVNLCYQWKSSYCIGPVEAHPRPQPDIPSYKSIQDHVAVRVFMDPGWNLNHTINGSNLMRYNVLALRTTFGPEGCIGLFDDPDTFHYIKSPHILQFINETDKEMGTMVEFRYHSDFEKDNSDLSVIKSRLHRHWVVSMCLYGDENDLNGTHVGDVEFTLDHADSSALVAVIVFVSVGMPVMLFGTVLCYLYKRRKAIKKLKKMQLYRQQERLQRQLLDQLVIQA
eukprot:Platyproteum_vivax@DN4111_c0_g1_i1.p1